MSFTDNEIKQVFEKAEAGRPRSNPYTASRVMAELSALEHKGKTAWWRNFALATSLTTALLVVVLSAGLLKKGEVFKVQSHEPILVEVNVKRADVNEVARAEIELPEGVYIYSIKHPELNGTRKINVAWHPQTRDAAFPFVVKSDLKGAQKVKVRFYDKNNNVAEEKIITLDFMG